MLRYINEPNRHFPPKRLYSSREEILLTMYVTSKHQAVFESDQWSGETIKQSKLQKTGWMEWACPALKRVARVGLTEKLTRAEAPWSLLGRLCYCHSLQSQTKSKCSSLSPSQYLKIQKSFKNYLKPTLTEGWRPLSKRASFLMMFPTPGNTFWSINTSHSIRPFCFFTSLSALEKLNLGEHTSNSSITLILCWLSVEFLKKGKDNTLIMCLVTIQSVILNELWYKPFMLTSI